MLELSGLTQARTVRSFGRDVARLGPDFLFLCETRLRTQSNSFLKSTLNFNSCFMVDVGPGCTCLAILWNNNITVDLLSYSPLHIDVLFPMLLPLPFLLFASLASMVDLNPLARKTIGPYSTNSVMPRPYPGLLGVTLTKSYRFPRNKVGSARPTMP